MGNYLPSTKEQREEMLKVIGLDSMSEFYSGVPAELAIKDGLKIPKGKSELEVKKTMSDIADKNIIFKTIFRGAGAYRHYIPSIVKTVTSKETLVTAYTPYQAEMSQGILQSIFEYQTMICELTGMDVSNASVYDGATAAAEAVAMCRDRKRGKALVSLSADPEEIKTIKTYCWASDSELEFIPEKDGATDLEALEKMLDSSTACVYVHQPSFSGVLEDCEKIASLAHNAGAKFIMGINPIAAAAVKSPGECGADVAVGEGQPLGMPLAFGGPYLGFLATKTELTRRLPGRIVGETTDDKGRRAFVLTLQAREQHIRREKASSNICSNQALCAMTAAIYLAAMGPNGLKEVAQQCHSKAHYLADVLGKAGLPLKNEREFFHEFVTVCGENKENLLKELEDNGILGGLPVDGGILWCATEMNTKEEMDYVASLVSEILKREE